MTADERIEKLLNRFGQTISNLPKPDERKRHYTYRLRTKQNLDKAAKNGTDQITLLAGTLLLIMHAICAMS